MKDTKLSLVDYNEIYNNMKNIMLHDIKYKSNDDDRCSDFISCFEETIKQKKQKKTKNGDKKLKKIRKTFMSLQGDSTNKWKWEENQIYFFELIMIVISKWIYGDELEENKSNIMSKNGWLKLSQFLNIVAPRRIGKSTLVGATCASILLNIPNVLISVYSLCQRTSIEMGIKIKSFIEKYETINNKHYSQFQKGVNNIEVFNLHNIENNNDIRTLKCYPASDKVYSQFMIRYSHTHTHTYKHIIHKHIIHKLVTKNFITNNFLNPLI